MRRRHSRILKRLRAFVAQKNPAAARRISKHLREGIGRLRQFPHMGRRVRQAPDQWAPEEIRDWVVGDYVVRYLVLERQLVVLRLWHGKEDRP